MLSGPIFARKTRLSFAEELGDAAGQFPTCYRIREKSYSQVVVDGSPGFAQRRVMQNLVSLFNDFIGDEHRHLDCLESERIDVSSIDGVGIDDDRLSKIDRFEEGISEAFVVAR